MDRTGDSASLNLTSTPARVSGDGACSLANASIHGPSLSMPAINPYVVHLPHLKYGVDESPIKYVDTLADNQVAVGRNMMELNRPMLEAQHEVNISAGRVVLLG